MNVKVGDKVRVAHNGPYSFVIGDVVTVEDIADGLYYVWRDDIGGGWMRALEFEPVLYNIVPDDIDALPGDVILILKSGDDSRIRHHFPVGALAIVNEVDAVYEDGEDCVYASSDQVDACGRYRRFGQDLSSDSYAVVQANA